jgi:uncharacterized membrane protein
MDVILIDVADILFSFFCHQRTDLLFTVLGITLPICSRCAGIYLGILLTFTGLSSCGLVRVRWSLGAALLTVMALEWTAGNLGLINSSAASRLLTGVLGGAGAAIILVHYGRRLTWTVIAILCVQVLIVMSTATIPTTIMFMIIWSFGLFWINAGALVKEFILPNQTGEQYNEVQS